MSAGSEAATEKLPEAFLPVKAFKIVVHTSMMIILGLFVLSLLRTRKLHHAQKRFQK